MSITNQTQHSVVLNRLSNSPAALIRAMGNSTGWSTLLMGYAVYALQSSATSGNFISSIISKISALLIIIACFAFIIDTLYVIIYPFVYLYYTYKQT